MLKEPEYVRFEDLKEEVLDNLREEQLKMNPERPVTAPTK